MYALCVVGGAVFVGLWPNLVALNVGVQVMNALLLPLVLGFLIALARRAQPPEQRIGGLYYALVLTVATATCLLEVFGGFSGAGLAG